MNIKKIFHFFLKNKKDFLFILFSFVIIFIYLFPALIAKEKLFFDDVSVTFTRLVAVAKSLRSGEFPLWDKNSFYGARPFYVLLESPVYNIFLYPFFFLTNLNDLDASFYYLYIIPFVLQNFFALLGFYLFCRIILKFPPFISSISSILYVLSPFFSSEIKSLHDTHIFSFIPWVLLFLLLYLNTGKRKWWFLSIIFLVSLSISVTLNFLIKAYFLIFVIVLVNGIYFLIKKRVKIFVLFNSFLVFFFSFFLLSFIWFGMLEGIKWITDNISFDYKEIVSDLHFNMFPGYLINIFIQDFHGLVSSKHAWGNAIKYDNNILINGGFFSSLFLVFACFIFFKRKKELENEEKFNFLLYLILYVFSIFILLGKFTPVFRILCIFLPFIFKMPYPFYFLFYQGIFYSILTGYGLFFALKENNIKSKFVFFYVIFIFVIIIIVLFEPLYESKILKFSISSLLELKEIKWLIFNKILLFIISALLAVFCFYRIKKIKIFFLIVLLLVETFFFAYISLYKNTVWARLGTQKELYPVLFRTRYLSPTRHFMIKDSYALKNFLVHNNGRFIGTVSSIDNLALLIDKRSVFGYDSKPVTKEMYEIIKKITENYPYELYLRLFPLYLFKNLGVDYILTYNFLFKEAFLNKNDLEYVFNNDPDYKAQNDWAELEYKVISSNNNNYKLHLYELIPSMPYLYFHSMIDSIKEEAQLKFLLYTDTVKKIIVEPILYKKFVLNKSYNLKETIEIEEASKEEEFDIYNEGSFNDELKHEVKLKQKDAGYEEDINNEGSYNDENKKELTFEEHRKLFDELNNRNKIIQIYSTNNKIELEVHVEEPAILVRNEAYHKDWKVTIKDVTTGKIVEKDKVHRVNYIMQGVFLKKGDYIVEFVFFPESLKIGLILSIGALIIFIIYSIFLYFKRQ